MRETLKQYREIKSQYPDAVVLFRYGDFYEAHYEDAAQVGKVLDITYMCSQDGIDVCGFPYFALDDYLPKLVRVGFRVAICAPIEPQHEQEKVKQTTTPIQLQLWQNL